MLQAASCLLSGALPRCSAGTAGSAFGGLGPLSRPAARRRCLRWAVAAWLAALAGCASVADRIDRQAQAFGFSRSVVTGDEYSHLIYVNRPQAGSDILHVYIENDGLPWWGRYAPAGDPTPAQPVMLGLMALDAAPALYLGRPCYGGLATLPPCTPLAWTHERYSPRVVDSMAAALRRATAPGGAPRLVFLGHSGGGALAVLLAQRFAQTVAVVTLAGNLDVGAWTRRHGYAPLDGSLDPMACPPLAPGIVQRHYVGSLDRNVTPDLLRRYAGKNPHAVVVEIDGVDHDCCWPAAWPRVLHELEAALAR